MTAIADRERARLIQAALQQSGLAAVLAWQPSEIVLVTGIYPHFGQTLCLYPRSGRPVVYVPMAEPPDLAPAELHIVTYDPGRPGQPAAWEQLRRLIGLDCSRLAGMAGLIGVALEDGQETLPAYGAETPSLDADVVRGLLGERAVDAGGLFAALAQHKTRHEIGAIRRANAVAADGLETFYQLLRPGHTEAEIAGQVEAAIQAQVGQAGITYARGWAYVQGGPNAARAGRFSRSSDRELSMGDMVVLELATCVNGYWSDLTRTGVVGPPSFDQAQLLAAVREAQTAAIGMIRPGVEHQAVDQAARSVLAGHGFDTGFTHATGHHVGFGYHDAGPLLAPGSPAPLEPGMVVTVEPGAYGAGFGGGARFEDNVLVTETGAEVLSPHHIV